MLPCNCDIGPEPTEVIVTNPVEQQTQKLVDYCDAMYLLVGEATCRKGKHRVISTCEPDGVITEVSRLLLGDDCRVVTAAHTLPGPVSVRRCENVYANIDLCPTVDTTYTIANIIQTVLDAGVVAFPSGVTIQFTSIISSLEITLHYIGNMCAGTMAISSDATINKIGVPISLNQGDSREFKAECGYPIQPITSISIKSGSGVAICIQFSNWVECLV